jgi:hypothetical protein
MAVHSSSTKFHIRNSLSQRTKSTLRSNHGLEAQSLNESSNRQQNHKSRRERGERESSCRSRFGPLLHRSIRSRCRAGLDLLASSVDVGSRSAVPPPREQQPAAAPPAASSSSPAPPQPRVRWKGARRRCSRKGRGGSAACAGREHDAAAPGKAVEGAVRALEGSTTPLTPGKAVEGAARPCGSPAPPRGTLLMGPRATRWP